MLFFLPTGSNNAHARRPWVTLSIGALCIATFVYTSVIDPPRDFEDALQAISDEHEGDETLDREGIRQELLTQFDRLGGGERRLGLVPARGFKQVGWVTNLFVHFDFFHIAGNLLFLWIVGPLLEEAWGKRRFAIFYLSFGLFASLVQFLLDRNSLATIGGASGAIAGCMGAFTVRFALTKIRFHYFIWFIRIFVGSVFVPAWICGVLWFANEVFNLKSGDAAGVATGAHVGGFFLGAIIALAIKALGFERNMLTVAESEDERAQREGWYAEASAAVARGDFDGARESLRLLTTEVPDHPGAAILFAEADLRGGRGQARLEKLVRGMLEKNDQQLDDVIKRLWPAIDPKAFSPAIAWKLAEKLRAWRPAVDREIVDGLVEAVASGTGSLALKARAMREQSPPPSRREFAADPSSLGSELELSSTRDESSPGPQLDRTSPLEPAPPGGDLADAAGPSGAEVVAGRVIDASLISVSPNGLEVTVNGSRRVVPWVNFVAVHAAVIPRGAGKVLIVDLVVKSATPTALRLQGSDPAVASLYAGQTVPQAWQSFLSGVRGAAGLAAQSAPWTEAPSLEALQARWAS
ncbi:MAG: rhomboid family intramembrane serine protease [Archangium sp.]